MDGANGSHRNEKTRRLKMFASSTWMHRALMTAALFMAALPVVALVTGGMFA
jgi:hypothetical protein